MTGQLIVLPTLASQNQTNTLQQEQLPSSSLSSTSTPPSSSSISASITIPQGETTQQVKAYYLPNPRTVTANLKSPGTIKTSLHIQQQQQMVRLILVL